MEQKHELTEKLKYVETEIYDAKIELKAINSKLENSYAYESELNQRLTAAKEKTEALRLDFFKKSTEISNMYEKMKSIFDVFTGNFYKH